MKRNMYLSIVNRCVYTCGLSLLAACLAVCEAADKPAGVVTSQGSFQVDGSTVVNSATVFDGNKIDCGVAGCSLRLDGGAVVQLTPQSGVIVRRAGVEIEHGQVKFQGLSDLTIPTAPGHVQPSSQSVLNGQMVNGQFTMDALKGSAQLMLSGSDVYARVDAGTRMRLASDSAQPIGVDLLVVGCLRRKDGHWYLRDEHMRREVEINGETIEKEHSRLEIRGAMQPLTGKSDGIVAQIQVLSEKRVEGGCPAAFLPIAGGVAVAAVTVSAIIPILNAPRLSVP